MEDLLLENQHLKKQVQNLELLVAQQKNKIEELKQMQRQTEAGNSKY